MALFEFKLPDIGEGTAEGEIVKWHIKEGQSIKEDDPMVEVMTDKATVVIPSPINGVVVKLFHKEGEMVPVHSLIATFEVGAAGKAESKPIESKAHQQEATMELNRFAPENAGSVYEFNLPDIGEGTAEGEIVKWHVSVGQLVKEDDPLVEIMTDKATVVIPSPKNGKIVQLHYKEGDLAPVHTKLVTFQLEGEVGNTPAAEVKTAHTPTAKVEAPKTVAAGNFKDILATPATRRLARDLGVDLTLVAPTGKNGRITDEDVKNFRPGTQAKPTTHSTTTLVRKEAALPAKPSEIGLVEEIPFTGIRRKIADKMVQSKFTAVHFTHMDEVDVTEVVELREKLKASLEKEGIKITYVPFILKALTETLKRNPKLNVSLNVEKNVIERKFFYNIGIAMDTPNGLIVPVIRDVDKKSIVELSIELKDLVDRTKAGQVKPDELRDGTFTLSNVGGIGGLLATPIINFPEAAIMVPGKIQQRAVVVDGEIKVRWMMYHSWTADHRIVDGADVARAANDFIRYLSHPDLLLVNLK